LPAAPVAAPVAAAAAPTVELASLPQGLELVRAPSLGVFYRSPKPGAPPFVEPGSRVDSDTTVGLVEVMKLFSSVPARCAGTVTHVLAADGAMVAEGQPLVAVRPGS
jgi:acetyl-CoA carboxylase biotin carboxyl carrier protein